MAKTLAVQTFSADAIAKIAAAVRRLNNEPRNRPPRERQWPGYTKRGHMWGTTAVCAEFPDYPAEIDAPNTYCVRLQEWHFTEIPGQQPVSMIDWEQFIVARAVANVGETQPYLPEGTGVEVWPVATRRGIRWWMRATSEVASSPSSSESSTSSDSSDSSDSSTSPDSSDSSDGPSSSASSVAPGTCQEPYCIYHGILNNGDLVWVALPDDGFLNSTINRCYGYGCTCLGNCPPVGHFPSYEGQLYYCPCNS